MIKKIFISICLLISTTIFSQESTASPYSFYGLGEVKFKGTIENNSMGGIAVLQDSIHLNIKNPAFLPSLKLTAFSVGGSYSLNTIESYNQEAKANRFNFDYLAVGIPLNKFGVSLGLLPYSAVGYKIQTNPTEENPVFKRYNGNGGINKVFTALGYQINKNLSIGVDLQYNFGKIETSSTVYEDQIQFGTRELNNSSVSGVNFNTSIAFVTKLNKKLSLSSTVTYSPEADLSLTNTRTIQTVQLNSLTGTSVIDESIIPVNDEKLKLPSKLTVGIGIGQEKKWMIGSELSFIGTSSFGNRFNDINNVTFENATRFNIGGYYINKYNSFTNFLDKIVFRGGFRYENTGLILNNQAINEQAFSFGLGLPVPNTLFSNINLGFEFGKRGTLQAGLVKENFGNIMVGLSLNDKWFQKRKYD